MPGIKNRLVLHLHKEQYLYYFNKHPTLVGTVQPLLTPFQGLKYVEVLKYKFNKLYKVSRPIYFRMLATDYDNISDIRDMVVIKKLDKQPAIDVFYAVERVLLGAFGENIDPVTGKECLRTYGFRDFEKKRDEMLGIIDSTYQYEKAPPKGSQRNIRDFSHRFPFRKYHEYEKGHPRHDDWAATP